jgi:hypothetical protein
MVALLSVSSMVHADEDVAKPVLEGIWAGEHTCRGHQRRIIVYFEAGGGQATAVFSTAGKKAASKAGQYQLGVDVAVDPSGMYKVTMKPKYWLDNPGKGRMVGFRGKLEGTTLTGKVTAKGCKKFRLERLPCERVPQACSAGALGPLQAQLPPTVLAPYGIVPGAPPGAPAIIAPLPLPGQPTVQRPGPDDEPMAKANFQNLVSKIENQSFKRKRVEVIERASKRHFFSCAQIATMLRSLSFKGERLKAIRVLVPRVTDPENSSAVLEVLTFRDEQRKAEAAFNQL